jgi:hypothetical protein
MGPQTEYAFFTSSGVASGTRSPINAFHVATGTL